MIGVLLWNSWRDRLTRPILVFLMIVGGASMFIASFAGLSDDLLNPAGFMTLIFAVGSIGRDLSSGTLALLFTRPLQRWLYVASRWLGAGIASTVASALHILIQFLILRSLGKAPPIADIAAMIFEATTTAFGLAAVIVLLSTLVPGLADVGLWIGIRVLLGLAGGAGVPQRLREQLDALTSPELAWATIASGGTDAWFAMASYASNVSLCLALAVAVINRKELSYASG
jgi:ABC-type transport system involved in multi-copper enzyme maturation permease subunit